MTDNEIVALIERRRNQMLVTSYAYYHLDQNIISDAEWVKRAHELQQLQEKYPKLSRRARKYDQFVGWDGSTGYDLKFDKKTKTTAKYLLKVIESRRGG